MIGIKEAYIGNLVHKIGDNFQFLVTRGQVLTPLLKYPLPRLYFDYIIFKIGVIGEGIIYEITLRHFTKNFSTLYILVLIVVARVMRQEVKLFYLVYPCGT